MEGKREYRGKERVKRERESIEGKREFRGKEKVQRE